jgi:predicted transposase/invertase (TIGR01784 family)
MSESKYLDPKNDIAFKRVFGEEKNKDILIPFLNEVMGNQYHSSIVSVTLLPTEQRPKIASSKTSAVDILCEDRKGTNYIIEMQVAQHGGFQKRANTTPLKGMLHS